jgi:hypothetical protein
MGLKRIGYEGVEWIYLAHGNAKLCAVLNLAIKLREFLHWRTNIGFFKRDSRIWSHITH